MLKLGKYRHYKGNEYQVIGIAKHSETLEDLVVYKKLYDDHGLWVRPLKMFIEKVDVDGKKVPRFEYIGKIG
jgi:cyclomaltodextrinase / maltogenic alpha-amylase / neopullulanase